MRKLALTKMKMPKGQPERWRKKYHREIYYFRGPYADALQQWERKKVELDSQDRTRYEKTIERRQDFEIAFAFAEKGISEEGLRRLAEIPTRKQLEDALAKGGPLPPLAERDIEPWNILPLADKEIVRPGYRHANARRQENAAANNESTHEEITAIGKAIDEWLQGKKSQVVLGLIKQSTLSSTKNDITTFRKWAGDKLPLTSINEKLLLDFYNFLAGEIANNRMMVGYAHQVLLYTKSFVRRQWELRRIELPRNIRSRDLSIRVPTAEIKTLSMEDIKAYFDRGTSLLRTCILLSLNCGFNQVDIATLKHSEVNWDLGTITKKRVKTGNVANVPTVRWKLWPITLEQLRKHRSKHPELVLLGRKDRELMQGGGLERVDVIGKMWRYVRNELGIRREYKLLRKTASSILASHAEFGKFTQYFLCHSASSVADRHYVKPSQDQFDKAIEWLGTQFSCLNP